MKWTIEQQQAIEKSGSNIIVSAGAGSGKTAVLAERVIRILKSGIDIRNILILSFTNEAANEMAVRIRKKIKEADLKGQLELIDAAYITTFDAFAFNVVKKYHSYLNISKQIKIVDSSFINVEKKKILDDIFLDLYSKKDTDFLKLIGDFTLKDDALIKKAILNLNKDLDLKYDKKKYLNKYISEYYDCHYIENIFKEYFDYLKDLVDLIINNYYALLELIDEKKATKLTAALENLMNIKSYKDLYKIGKISLPRFVKLEEDAKLVKEDLTQNVKLLNSLIIYSEEELKNQLVSTKVYVKAIIKIILTLDEKIWLKKKELEAFEFVDIAKMAITLVKDFPIINQELKSQFFEIMIDEYQDTNDLQEIFINSIANNNVYMVGDIKQSIYRFRNANPNIFKEKYQKYKKGDNGIKIDLVKNFRSRLEVLKSINEIFSLIMTPEIGDVDYLDNHSLIFGNEAYLNEGNNNFNHKMAILKYEEGYLNFDNDEIEAFAIAKDIKDKMKAKYLVYDFDLKKNRKVEYRDFCIILDRGTSMPIYKKIFEYLKIPMDIYRDENINDDNDFLIIKNIIQLIIAIYQKKFDTKMRYYFLSIARSYIANEQDEQIFDELTNNNFYNTDIFIKCNSIANILEDLTPATLLEKIIFTFNFYENFIKVGNVENASVRLEYLLDLASSMEELGFSIFDLNNYLDDLIENKEEIRYKQINGIGNCVKIMNIHKSKGLEFPICYFAGFKKDFNLKDLTNRFIFSNTYGFVTPYYQEGIGTLFTKTLVKNQYLKEEISEKIRLLYVALTRSKEQIVIVLPNFKNEGYVDKKIDFSTGFSYRSFYDFIESIAKNLSQYYQTIDMTKLDLTKNYLKNLKKEIFPKNNISNEIDFINNKINSNLIEEAHASKEVKQILTSQDKDLFSLGLKIHSLLEKTDFKNYKGNNAYILNLLNTFDFKNADIYQELEFYYTNNDINYHGIIDLLLEYDQEFIIFDYKLKNIDDEAYTNQLLIYFNYIKSISNKNIKVYLYSILENKLKKIEL